jgi:sec-independent protein translocase protein TatC
MTFAEHLVELRRRLIIAVVAVLAMSVVAFVFYPQMLKFLQRPYCESFPKHCSFYIQDPLDGLSLRFKMATFGGLLLASPIVLWELWRFITPGLKANEKRYAIPFIVSSIVLFLAGCAVAYFSFEHALVFLTQIGGPSLTAFYDPSKYIRLILLMMVLFGLTFLFPVLLVSLELAGVVTPAQLLKAWRWAVLGITISAAVFTPSGDPISMLAMMVPLIVFYFAAIGLGKLFGR